MNNVVIVSGDNKGLRVRKNIQKHKKRERRKRTQVTGGERRDRQRDLKNSKELVNCG